MPLKNLPNSCCALLKGCKMDDVSAAKTLIASLDLTSLNIDDTDETIRALCTKSATAVGQVAAVCIYPRFIPLAKTLLPPKVKIATVVNFPSGLADIGLLEKEILNAVKLGADEIDVVFPYRTFLSGDIEFCTKYLTAARQHCGKKVLKAIIETGELKTVAPIKKASELCISANIDFIKTSTGKTSVSATPEAANIILETIKQSGKPVGFKASGGIKTFEDAKKYLILALSIMGPNWPQTNRFRIGASSLLTNLLEIIKRGY